MKALIIGGSGTISSAVVSRLLEKNWDVTVLNRGNHKAPEGVTQLTADIKSGEAKELLKDQTFDTVCEFVAFVPEDVERDIRLFEGKTGQYVFISSASAYHKPAGSCIITEGTALSNPYWAYSRNKIACEEVLMARYRETGFPVTIVRPSHTYSERTLPVAVHGAQGSWQVLDRMLKGKPVIVHGDGSSLWTVTFSSDFAVGFTGLLCNRHAIGEAVQITGDEALTWDQIYETVGQALGVTPRLYHVSSDLLAEFGRDYDLRGALLGDKAVSVIFDNSKLKRLVPEFTTRVPFHEGARRSVDFFLSHESARRADPDFDSWSDRVITCLENARKAF